MLLKKLIKEVEAFTGEKFDFDQRRHFFHLNQKIERLHKDELRKLHLIKEVLRSSGNEDSLYNSGLQYARNRYKEQ